MAEPLRCPLVREPRPMIACCRLHVCTLSNRAMEASLQRSHSPGPPTWEPTGKKQKNKTPPPGARPADLLTPEVQVSIVGAPARAASKVAPSADCSSNARGSRLGRSRPNQSGSPALGPRILRPSFRCPGGSFQSSGLHRRSVLYKPGRGWTSPAPHHHQALPKPSQLPKR